MSIATTPMNGVILSMCKEELDFVGIAKIYIYIWVRLRHAVGTHVIWC